MERKDVLLNDVNILTKNFIKVLEIDLNNDAFYPVKVADNDTPPSRRFNEWIYTFTEENIYKTDQERYLQFFTPTTLKEQLKTDWMARTFYRRLIDGKWKWVSAEIVPLQNYTEDDALCLLVIREIDDYIDEFRKQVEYDNL